MKMKRALAALMTAMMIAGAVGGCGGSENAGGNTSRTQVNNKAEKAKLLYTYWGSAFEKEAQATAVEAFNKQYPDIEVEALHIPSSGTEYVAKITAMAASETNPDVGYMDVPTAFVWAKEDKFYNIFDLISSDPDWSKDKYVDDIFYMYGENESFGTTSSINPRAIFYNQDCFEAAGIEAPPTKAADAWTWDEFIEVARELTIDMNGKNALDPDFDSSRIKQYGIYLSPVDMAGISIFMDSNNADILSEDGSKLAFDTPEAKEVLQAIHDMIYVHHVSPIPNDFSSMPDGPTWLKNKQAAMFITGQWVLLDIGKLDFNYGIGQLPKFKEVRNIKDAGVRVIFKNTKYPEAAWEFYKFLANPSGAMSLYAEGLWMPTLREWYDDPDKFNQWGSGNAAHPNSYKEVIADSLFNGTSTPSWGLRIANYSELNNIISPILQQLWLDSTDVDTVVEQINNQAGDKVTGYNPGNYHISKYRK